jgi:hypothetical protein
MRADLHREYKHPTTGLVASLTDIAKEFNLNISVARRRLIRQIPLDKPTRKNRKAFVHPTTGLLEPMAKIAEDFGISYALAYARLKNGMPLGWSKRQGECPESLRKPGKLFGTAVVLGVNPITGTMQNKHELATALGISPQGAKAAILAGRTGRMRGYTEVEKLDKLNKKKAAQAEMAKLIADLDERKAMLIMEKR